MPSKAQTGPQRLKNSPNKNRNLKTTQYTQKQKIDSLKHDLQRETREKIGLRK